MPAREVLEAVGADQRHRARVGRVRALQERRDLVAAGSAVQVPKRFVSGWSAIVRSLAAVAGTRWLSACATRFARPHSSSTKKRAPCSGLPFVGATARPSGLSGSRSLAIAVVVDDRQPCALRIGEPHRIGAVDPELDRLVALDVAVVVDRDLERRFALAVLEVDAARDRLVLELRLRRLVVPDAVAHLAVAAGVAAHDGDRRRAGVLLDAEGVGGELHGAARGGRGGGRQQREGCGERQEEAEDGRRHGTEALHRHRPPPPGA